MRKFFLPGRAALVALILCFAGQASAAPSEVGVRGRLARTIEAGGWLIDAGAQKYLLVNAPRFRGEPWFREGAEVEATGETRPDVVTTHMEGTPFEARALGPQGGGAAQSPAGREGALTRVVVSGDALVQAQPDTAIVTIAVVTQNASASEAQAENASKSEAVVRAVRAAAGPDAEVKTSGYSLQPQYVYREGAEPRISGYTARNSVTVTLGDLPRVGAVIDAATRAGANNVDNLAFTLRRDQQARSQALTDATREALGKARLLAQTLGGRVVRIVEVQEGGTMVRPPVPVYARAEMRGAVAGDAAQTPIEIGTLDIRSEVQLVAEITAAPQPN